jgi:hypothetical protein
VGSSDDPNTCTPTFLPEAVVRLVDLGPRVRPTEAGPLILSSSELDHLTSSDAGRRGAAPDRTRSSSPGSAGKATAQPFGGGAIARWEAVATWGASNGSSGRRGVQVIDSAAGMWLVEPLGLGLMASPTTPSVLWRLLTALLPSDDELGRAADTSKRRPGEPPLDGV